MEEIPNQKISLVLMEELAQIFKEFKESEDREKLGGNKGVHLLNIDPPF